jgi:hypothetical protein
MVIVAIVSLLASVWVVGAYAYSVKTGKSLPMHMANAIGCWPIIVSEALVGSWAALIVTASFGVVGLVGCWRAARASRARKALRRVAPEPEACRACYGEGLVSNGFDAFECDRCHGSGIA